MPAIERGLGSGHGRCNIPLVSENCALVAVRGTIGLSLLIAGASAASAEYEPRHVDQSCPTPPPVVGQSVSAFLDPTTRLPRPGGWHYTPAVRNGGYVSDWMGLKIEFARRETGNTLKPPTADEVEACAD